MARANRAASSRWGAARTTRLGNARARRIDRIATRRRNDHRTLALNTKIRSQVGVVRNVRNRHVAPNEAGPSTTKAVASVQQQSKR
eukprot:83804-Prymnesium_polylepis.1